MSVVVVATLTPRPGRLSDVLAAFAGATPLVHEESGCELYAAHTNDEVVIMVERWTTAADLEAHANGAAIAHLNELIGDALVGPAEVLSLTNVPLGDPAKGTIR